MNVPALSPLWLAAIPGLLAVALWAVTDVQRFVLFAVLTTMVLPQALASPGGTQIALADILLLVALAGWLIAGSLRAVPGPWITGNRLLLPTVLFVAVNAESLLWSDRPHDTLIFTIQLVEIVVIFTLVFASLPTSTDAIRRGLFIFIGCACVMALVTAILYAPRAAAGELEGQYLPYGLNKNTIGSFLAAALVMAYTFWLMERKRDARYALAFSMLLLLAGLFSTVSRGAIIGAIAAVLIASVLLKRRRLVTFGVVGLAALTFLLTIGVKSGVDRSQSGSYDSSVVRQYSYEGAVRKIKEDPILGSGAGTYIDYLPQLDNFGVPDPNNMFLLTWAEIGIVGMLALVFLLACYVRLLVRSRHLPAEAAAPAVAAGCVTMSLFVHFQVDVTWTRGTSSLAFAMMGLMLAVGRLAQAEADDAADASPSPPPTAHAGARSPVGVA